MCVCVLCAGPPPPRIPLSGPPPTPCAVPQEGLLPTALCTAAVRDVPCAMLSSEYVTVPLHGTQVLGRVKWVGRGCRQDHTQDICWGLELEEPLGGHSGDLGYMEGTGVVAIRLFDCRERQVALPPPPPALPLPLGSRVFNSGGGVDRAPENRGGGFGKRAQLTGPSISIIILLS